MSMVTRGHFIATKIFPVGEQPGARTKARGFPLPLAPPTITTVHVCVFLRLRTISVVKYIHAALNIFNNSPLKPKVHYAIWSETCSKPAGDLLASKSQTCMRA